MRGQGRGWARGSHPAWAVRGVEAAGHRAHPLRRAELRLLCSTLGLGQRANLLSHLLNEGYGPLITRISFNENAESRPVKRHAGAAPAGNCGERAGTPGGAPRPRHPGAGTTSRATRPEMGAPGCRGPRVLTPWPCSVSPNPAGHWQRLRQAAWGSAGCGELSGSGQQWESLSQTPDDPSPCRPHR